MKKFEEQTYKETYKERCVVINGHTINYLADLIATFIPAAQGNVDAIMKIRDKEIDALDDEFGFERRP